VLIKEIVERRHGKPILKILLLPKMGVLGSQASNEKKPLVMNYKLLWRAVFYVLTVKNLLLDFLHCSILL
jgi:hypothetical protein